MEKKKADARNKGEESSPDPGGKNIQHGGHIVERIWGIGTALTAWRRRTEVGTPKRAVS